LIVSYKMYSQANIKIGDCDQRMKQMRHRYVCLLF
jgi:hypothetical protein